MCTEHHTLYGFVGILWEKESFTELWVPLSVHACKMFSYGKYIHWRQNSNVQQEFMNIRYTHDSECGYLGLDQ